MKQFKFLTQLAVLLLAVPLYVACGDDEETNPPAPSSDVSSLVICPDSNHPHFIDLGIGTKWACCNLGASAPHQYGNYYAWGETKDKGSYSIDNYPYYNNGEFQNINIESESDLYDAARVNWADTCRIPTLVQCKDLINNTESKWVTFNGTNGMLFVGKNGNAIFIPAAGYRSNDETFNEGTLGDYLSSTSYNVSPDRSYSFNFGNSGIDCGNSIRYNGHSVRAVCTK